MNYKTKRKFYEIYIGNKRFKIRKFEVEDAAQLYKNHLENEVKQYISNECYVDMKET